MSSGDHAEHSAEELKGKVKSGVGDAVGNEQMQAEGKSEETSAKFKQAGDNLKDAAGDAKRAVKD